MIQARRRPQRPQASPITQDGVWPWLRPSRLQTVAPTLRVSARERRGVSRELKTIGRHLIAEFYACKGDLLDDVEAIRERLRAAAETIGATIVGDTFHRFCPQGVSGSVVIAESHLSIHTWPETGYVAVDIYTCGGLDPHVGFEYLGHALGAQSCRVQEIVRGLPEDVNEDRPLLPEDVRIMARDVVVTSISAPS